MNESIAPSASATLSRVTAAYTDAVDKGKSHIHAHSDGSFTVGKRPMMVRAFHQLRSLFTKNDRLAQANERAIGEFQDAISSLYGARIANRAIAAGRATKGNKTAMSVDFIKATFAKVNHQLAKQYKVGNEHFDKIYDPNKDNSRTYGQRQQAVQQLQRNETKIKSALKEAAAMLSDGNQRVLSRADMDYAFSHLMAGMNYPVHTASRGGASNISIEQDIRRLGAQVRLS